MNDAFALHSNYFVLLRYLVKMKTFSCNQNYNNNISGKWKCGDYWAFELKICDVIKEIIFT